MARRGRACPDGPSKAPLDVSEDGSGLGVLDNPCGYVPRAKAILACRGTFHSCPGTLHAPITSVGKGLDRRARTRRALRSYCTSALPPTPLSVKLKSHQLVGQNSALCKLANTLFYSARTPKYIFLARCSAHAKSGSPLNVANGPQNVCPARHAWLRCPPGPGRAGPALRLGGPHPLAVSARKMANVSSATLPTLGYLSS